MDVRQFIKTHIVYLDGGMGTLLQDAGLAPGELPERWNITHPAEVTAIHQAYFDAGSHIVNTNTFGANGLKFGDQELEQIIAAAIANVRKAAAASSGTQEKFCALDIGPCGKLLRPYGDFAFEDAVALFGQIVRLGVTYGADLITIETMADSYETKAALLAAKENSDLPVLVTNAYGEDGKLMTGADPEAMVALLEGLHADAIGVNCSLGPDQLAPIVRRLLACSSLPIIMKPNAGLPRSVDGKTVYDIEPEEFAKQVATLMKEGVRIAGGCCGTNPAFIQALVRQTANLSPVPVTEKDITWVSSYTHAVSFGQRPLLIGERINPTGKKRFKQALVDHDLDYILQEGIGQQEQGVHILDVNVGLPEIDEAAVLQEACYELQAIIDLPLQIDTADAVAMEAALRQYNGKALINSVSGKESSMEAIFPLVSKYGGTVICLTLDDEGIPPTADGRVAIAEKIIQRAATYGIAKKDLVFDTLALTVSAEPDAAMTTLEALRRIREDLGCHTSLGVSNVSFGLPARDGINCAFFCSAMEKGLSAAIMNPFSGDMLRTYYAYCALHGLDENCATYIQFAQQWEAQQAASASASTAPSGSNSSHGGASGSTPAGTNASIHGPAGQWDTYASPLQRAIVKGLKDQAAQLTREVLQEREPLAIVQEEVIPALNIVGDGFEKKTLFLPQLLMSAEAAKSAFGEIKAVLETLPSAGSQTGETFVIATVHGDIHDIGKNIVKLLLENYGFDVHDLGRDVAPERIVQEVVDSHAAFAGLSALMTTTVPAMEETIRQLREAAPWCRIVVGGAVLTQEYADRMGANKYGRDAMDTVRYAETSQ